jgi:hypothetical protein
LLPLWNASVAADITHDVEASANRYRSVTL